MFSHTQEICGYLSAEIFALQARAYNLSSPMCACQIETYWFVFEGPDILLFHEPIQAVPGLESSNDFKCNETVVMQLWMQKRDKTYLKNSMLDRSPCGTGSIALATKFWQSGVLAIGKDGTKRWDWLH